MVLLDYHCEDRELFRETHAFYGAPFFWDYLGNFGGNTFLVGPMDKINRRLTAVMNDPALTNFVGVGATLEGFNNPVVYEMLFDRVWAGTNLDLAAWTRAEACARAGGADANVEQAWDLLRRKILADGVNHVGAHGAIFQDRNPTLRGEDDNMLPAGIGYHNQDLIRAWGLLLQAGPVARQSSAYQADLVEVTRQALSNLGLTLRQRMAEAYERKDAAAFKAAAGQFLALGDDLDTFLGTRSEFLLGQWIDDAKSWAGDKAEQSYYEKDARSIITVWGGNLTDYAGREWNGLVRDYYLPRWQLLINAQLAELNGGKSLDRPALQKQWREHDWEFASSAGGHYAVKARGDSFSMSRALFKKYVGRDD
jgi:alpha-N-acetylglucosaminidase